jgi:hypothetical protein
MMSNRVTCLSCWAIFSTQEECDLHECINEKYTIFYECKTCCAKFNDEQKINRHICQKEIMPISFICPDCLKKFNDTDRFQIHLIYCTSKKNKINQLNDTIRRLEIINNGLETLLEKIGFYSKWFLFVFIFVYCALII